MRLFCAAFLCSFAALGAPDVRSAPSGLRLDPTSGRVGLYPLVLPSGQEQLGGSLAAQLHDGAAALPGVRAFDLVAHSACGADEPPCLAAAARRAGLDAMISAAVTATAAGYAWHLRVVGADEKLLAERQGELRGGPLDLAGALEHGVCEALGAAPCEGVLRVGSGAGEQRSLVPSAAVNSVHLFVDGADRGALPVEVRLPVGRHAVKLGDSERRIRISFARTVRLAGPALLDEPEVAPLAAVSATPVPVGEPRRQASRILLASGVALLATAGGLGLYTGSTAATGPRTAGYAAAALAATGAGAIVAGGLLLALTPSGAALHGEF